MSLHVVAIPIGNPLDLSPRGREVIESCCVIIAEERKALFQNLKSFGIKISSNQTIYFLNEHTKKSELSMLLSVCAKNETALISDCGTPSFCDPGADLVRACREKGIRIHCVPGVCSLTAFLSVCGWNLKQFFFRGFLPVEKHERQKEILHMRKETKPIILMDTPYRLNRLLEELKKHLPTRELVLGTELSREQERIISGKADQILRDLSIKNSYKTKAEFILLLLPDKTKKS